MKNCFLSCLQSVSLEVQRMWRGGRGIKEDEEGSEFSEESLGFSLYIFYDTCDVKKKKIKSTPAPSPPPPRAPSPHERIRCKIGKKPPCRPGLHPGILSHAFYSCISCLDLDRIF